MLVGQRADVLHDTNNLFIGPTALDPDGHAVRWDVPSVATAKMDYDGFYPDGQYQFAYGSAARRTRASPR